MAVRMAGMLIGYALVLCIALICSCTVFSLRMRTCVISNALQMSVVTMTRSVESTAAALDSVQTNLARIAFTLVQTANLASNHPMASPLSVLDGAFQMLRPPNTMLAILAQEEVWWSEEESVFITAGCYRYGTLCYRSNGTTTSYAVSTFPTSALDYGAVYTVNETSQYYDLHQRMMQQPQFAGPTGIWTPQVARFTIRQEAQPCASRHMEYVMAHYHCLSYVDYTDNPRFPLDSELPIRQGYCVHAVMAVVDLKYRIPFTSSGFSPASTVEVQSLLVLDEVHNATCTQEADRDLASVASIGRLAARMNTQDSPIWAHSIVFDDDVITQGMLQQANGVLIAFRETTPSVFFLATSRSDNITSAVLTTALVVVVLLVTLFMWCTVARPLQQVCVSMQQATTGVVDAEEDAGEGGGTAGGNAPRKAKKRAFVKEVNDLYQTYHRLRVALSELKAFAPQGLFVPERDGAAAVDDECVVHVAKQVYPSQHFSARGERFAAARHLNLPPTDVTVCPTTEAMSGGFSRPPPAAAAATAASSLRRPAAASNVARTPLLLPPHLMSSTRREAFSPLSSGVRSAEGPAAQLEFPALTRATTFRMVNCSTVTMSYHYAVSNLEMAATEVQQVMEVCIGVILAHGGTVEIFRPEVLVAAFGAHREDALHTKHAVECAVRLFDCFSPAQQKRASLLLDTGNIYVGTCGAHDRYARVIAGDRVEFIMRARLHALSLGRIIATDSVSLSRHSPTCYFVPFDNIVPRGGFGVQRSSTVLFSLYPKHALPAGSQVLVSAINNVFRTAVGGDYDTAMAQLRTLPAIDPVVRAAFVEALRTFMSVSPRRPRYCRFELPPFEALGFTAPPPSQSQFYKPLLIHDLEPAVPHVRFLSITDHAIESRTSLSAMRTSLLSPMPVPCASLTAATCASPDRSTYGSSAADNFLCGEPKPQTFRDSRGDCWTLVPDCIGRGASSEVYKAFSSDGVIMAVKCIQLARRDVRMCDVVAEVNTSCQLSSEYIVNCTSWAHVGTYLFIVMELLAGGSLHDTLRYFPCGITYTLVRRYAADVLHGLDYLHRNGIVHADVKPQNMLLATDGGCRISDFGSSITTSSARFGLSGDVYQLRGTPLYMSPEVARGESPTVRSDVWSFGVSLYEVLTGQLPWVWKCSGTAVYPVAPSHPASLDATLRRPPPQQQQQQQVPAVHHLLHPVAAGASLLDTHHSLPFTPRRDGAGGGRSGSAAASPSPPCPLMGRASSTPTSTVTPPSRAVPAVAAFLQSVIRGDIVVHIDPSLFTSAEAQHVIEACLRVRPEQRLTVEGLLYMQYFYDRETV